MTAGPSPVLVQHCTPPPRPRASDASDRHTATNLPRVKSFVGWAKALGTVFQQGIAWRAPCPLRTARLTLMSLVGTAYERLYRSEAQCQRLCPPYELRQASADQRAHVANLSRASRR